MTEVWLKNNARAMLVGTFPPALLAVAGLVLLTGIWRNIAPRWLLWPATLTTIAGLCMLTLLVWQWRRPRLAYRQGRLLVFLRWGQPLEVPIDFVEAFLLGQAPSFLPGKVNRQSEARTLVIRLADRATEWQQVDVEPRLGSWCGGYITIRGTWCEPLSVSLIERLNNRLRAIAREALAGKEAE